MEHKNNENIKIGVLLIDAYEVLRLFKIIKIIKVIEITEKFKQHTYSCMFVNLIFY